MSKPKVILHTRRCKIEDAIVGMIVRSFNIEAEQDEFREILTTFDPIVEHYRQHELILANGGTIVTSDIHPMLVFRDRWLYIPTSEVVVGDTVKDSGGISSVLEINVGCEYDEQFADIEVAGNNNYYATSNDSAILTVVHNSASVNYPGWHLEFEKLIELKNNKGTEETRIRTMDYVVAINGTMLKRLVTKGNITLFSPEEVPDLYDAFYSDDLKKFEELYVKYENSKTVIKKTIPAVDYFSKLMNERFETSRIYIFFADNVNRHSPFYESIVMTNLCVVPETEIEVLINGRHATITVGEAAELWNANSEHQMGLNLQVLSKNVDTGEISYKVIQKAWMTDTDREVIKITDEVTGKSITVTSNHPVWTKNRGWVEAGNLVENDELDIA